jgi:hypothetical protein
MKTGSLVAASAAALLASVPAHAGLNVAFQSGASTFHCADGQISCDLTSGTPNQILLGITTIGAFTVEGNFSASIFGHPNRLSDSNLTITNTSGSTATLVFSVGDTNFVPSTKFVNMSGSGTFNSDIGGSGELSFHADLANGQGGILGPGGVPTTPGVPLFIKNSGPITTDPFAFSGNEDGVSFAAGAPFSMTLDYSLTLLPGASVVGLESSMVTGVPEPSTWAMVLAGFALIAGMGLVRKKKGPIAIF